MGQEAEEPESFCRGVGFEEIIVDEDTKHLHQGLETVSRAGILFDV